MRLILFLSVPLLLAATASTAVSGLQATYSAAGATTPQASPGQAMWTQEATGPDGKPRSCASCHTADLRKAGRHATTAEAIDPMAPAVNPERYTESATIEKWFGRNCQCTWRLECTAQEKADFLSFLTP